MHLLKPPTTSSVEWLFTSTKERWPRWTTSAPGCYLQFPWCWTTNLSCWFVDLWLNRNVLVFLVLVFLVSVASAPFVKPWSFLLYPVYSTEFKIFQETCFRPTGFRPNQSPKTLPKSQNYVKFGIQQEVTLWCNTCSSTSETDLPLVIRLNTPSEHLDPMCCWRS